MLCHEWIKMAGRYFSWLIFARENICFVFKFHLTRWKISIEYTLLQLTITWQMCMIHVFDFNFECSLNKLHSVSNFVICEIVKPILKWMIIDYFKLCRIVFRINDMLFVFLVAFGLCTGASAIAVGFPVDTPNLLLITWNQQKQ